MAPIITFSVSRKGKNFWIFFMKHGLCFGKSVLAKTTEGKLSQLNLPQYQLEAVQSKINARNLELDRIELEILRLEAEEATFKDVFEPMQKFCMQRHVEPLPKKKHASLTGIRVNRNSVFMPGNEVSSKLGIERPSGSDEE